MHKHPGCYKILSLCCLGGATMRGREGERVEERREEEEEEERWEGAFYMVTSQVPS